MRITKYGIAYTEEKTLSLVKETSTNYDVGRRYAFRSPDLVADFAALYLNSGRMPEEHLWILALDSQCHMKGYFDVSHGTSTESIVDPKAIFQRLLLIGAVQFVMLHNHPSGDPTPSEADIATTKRIRECSLLLNIPLVDHIVVGDGYFSFANEKLVIVNEKG